MSEIQLKATNVADKPVRLGDLPVVKTNILENAGQMDKGVVGGYNGAFPLTAASEGGIYLLPSTGKFYVCETAYNGAQISAPNSNFVELSVWKNHDRLNTLFEIKEYNFIPSHPDVEFKNKFVMLSLGKIVFFSYYGQIDVKKAGISSIKLPFVLPKGINNYRIFSEILQVDNIYSSSVGNSAFNNGLLSISFKKIGEQSFNLSGVAPIV